MDKQTLKTDVPLIRTIYPLLEDTKCVKLASPRLPIPPNPQNPTSPQVFSPLGLLPRCYGRAQKIGSVVGDGGVFGVMWMWMD